jgi:hypothetical protein
MSRLGQLPLWLVSGQGIPASTAGQSVLAGDRGKPF